VPLRRLTVLIAFLLAAAAPARAQNPQPYIFGEVGGSFGDGGVAPAIVAGFGYLTPRNFGFEIEAAFVPGLDFADPGLPRIAIYPPITFETTGRLISLETHVVGVLPNGGSSKLRAFVLAGGGIADLRLTNRIHIPPFPRPLFPDLPVFPDLPDFPGLLDPSSFPELFLGVDREVTASETSMVLSAGAGFDYALTRHLGLGMSVRYQHLFNDPMSLDMARAAVRATWKF
jgi:hypothetical protein